MIVAKGEKKDEGGLCYDSAKAAVPQTLLETDEDRRLIARFDIDHTIRHEPGLRDEQVRARDAP
jgi:hypothetical protein